MSKTQRQIQDRLFSQVAAQLKKEVRNAEHIDEDEINRSWMNVEKAVHIRRRNLRKQWMYMGMAAGVAALLFSVVFFLSYQPEQPDALSLALRKDGLRPTGGDLQQIVLIAQDRTIGIEDDHATVHYKKDGSLQVNSKAVTGATPACPYKETDEPVKLNHIFVPKGKRANVVLADGTTIYINAGSHVIYPAVFAKEKREIAVEGEVFLEVCKDPNRPFVVKTNDFEVKVLGTSFNVSAYREDSCASVVLVNGSVRIKTARQEMRQLLPNQLAHITDRGVECQEVEVFPYICWKENMMLLTDRPVGEVLDKLARYYGKTIICEKSVGTIPISGKLDLRERIEDVMDIICLSLSLQFTVDDTQAIHVSKKNKM